MAENDRAHAQDIVVSYDYIRNTTPAFFQDLVDEERTYEVGKRKRYHFDMPISEFASALLPAGVNTEANIRDALDSKKSVAKSGIIATLTERPWDFQLLNGGMLIFADRIVIDDKVKKVSLFGATLSNGAQTQSAILEYLRNAGEEANRAAITVEAWEVSQDMVHPATIARNTTTPVKPSSLLNARHADVVEQLFHSFAVEGYSLERRESDTGIDVQLGKAIQIAFALLDSSVSDYTYVRDKTVTTAKNWFKDGRHRAYFSGPNRAIAEFNKLLDGGPNSQAAVAVLVKDAVVSYKFYEFFKKSPRMLGIYNRLFNDATGGIGSFSEKQAPRNKSGEIKHVHDGIAFVMASAIRRHGISNFKELAEIPDGTFERMITTCFEMSDNPHELGRAADSYEVVYKSFESVRP